MMAKLRVKISRREPIPLLTRDGTFPNFLDAKAICGICGQHDVFFVSHRNFIPPIDDEPARVKGSPVDHCYWCRAKTPGIRCYGEHANVSVRDHMHIEGSQAFAAALLREARHVR